MLSETIDAVNRIGGGSISDGIDKLAANLPIFERVRLYLEQRAAAGDHLAVELLQEVEALGFEQAYEDAIASGLIAAKGGAYIV